MKYSDIENELEKLAQDFGIGGSIREFLNIGGKLLEVSNADYREMMESIRQIDNAVRAIVTGKDSNSPPLKDLIKQAQKNLNRREYLEVISNCVQVNEIVKEAAVELNKLNLNFEKAHYQLLSKEMSGESLERLRKNIRRSSIEISGLKKQAGILDFFHNIFSTRGRELRNWEKRFPKAASELKRAASNSIRMAISINNSIVNSLKKMKEFRIGREIESYKNEKDRLLSRISSYSNGYNNYYKSAIEPIVKKVDESLNPEISYENEVLNERAAPETNRREDGGFGAQPNVDNGLSLQLAPETSTAPVNPVVTEQAEALNIPNEITKNFDDFKRKITESEENEDYYKKTLYDFIKIISSYFDPTSSIKRIDFLGKITSAYNAYIVNPENPLVRRTFTVFLDIICKEIIDFLTKKDAPSDGGRIIPPPFVPPANDDEEPRGGGAPPEAPEAPEAPADPADPEAPADPADKTAPTVQKKLVKDLLDLEDDDFQPLANPAAVIPASATPAAATPAAATPAAATPAAATPAAVTPAAIPAATPAATPAAVTPAAATPAAATPAAATPAAAIPVIPKPTIASLADIEDYDIQKIRMLTGNNSGAPAPVIPPAAV